MTTASITYTKRDGRWCAWATCPRCGVILWHRRQVNDYYCPNCRELFTVPALVDEPEQPEKVTMK